MLTDLFARLRLATAPSEIEALQDGIWQIWLELSDAELNKLLETGMRAMQASDHTTAIHDFSQIILLAPDLAEGWNKRATAYYLRGEYRASLDDIAETLAREPRHFGALWGKFNILRQLGSLGAASKTLKQLADLCPNFPGLREQQRTLQEGMEDDEL
jgi:tetratricopeptide (TPR) repeat protein